MTRLSAILTLATIGTATSFLLPFSSLDQQRLLAKANDETDFDAPILNDPVMQTDAPTVLDHEIEVVDDECYLGKYGQFDECVDFDPINEASITANEETTKSTKPKFELPDFTAIGEEISATFGKLFTKK